ncbi:MAG: ABC transporter transmembrane domain-containing protein [Paracoccaceae bacterium]
MLRLYAAIWRISSGRQLVLIVLSIAIAALAAVPLEFQKDIINLLTDKTLDHQHLYWLGAGMSAAILLSLGLKWIMGYRSGKLGEDLIRWIRKRITGRALAPAPGTERDVGDGTLTTAVSAEAEDLGKFAGTAFSEPVVQIGTLIGVIGYISSTQPGLGLIVLSMVVPQIVIVLVSQGKVNQFVAERVLILRSASDQLTREDANQLLEDVDAKYDAIYLTRRKMFLWKLSTKFLLSAINGAGLIAVLMLGGWLVLGGRTDVGTVVAATAGLSRIQGPTAFLIAFYRMVSANRIRFELLVDVFGIQNAQPKS